MALVRGDRRKSGWSSRWKLIVFGMSPATCFELAHEGVQIDRGKTRFRLAAEVRSCWTRAAPRSTASLMTLMAPGTSVLGAKCSSLFVSPG